MPNVQSTVVTNPGGPRLRGTYFRLRNGVSTVCAGLSVYHLISFGTGAQSELNDGRDGTSAQARMNDPVVAAAKRKPRRVAGRIERRRRHERGVVVSTSE